MSDTLSIVRLMEEMTEEASSGSSVEAQIEALIGAAEIIRAVD